MYCFGHVFRARIVRNWLNKMNKKFLWQTCRAWAVQLCQRTFFFISYHNPNEKNKSRKHILSLCLTDRILVQIFYAKIDVPINFFRSFKPSICRWHILDFYQRFLLSLLSLDLL